MGYRELGALQTGQQSLGMEMRSNQHRQARGAHRLVAPVGLGGVGGSTATSGSPVARTWTKSVACASGTRTSTHAIFPRARCTESVVLGEDEARPVSANPTAEMT